MDRSDAAADDRLVAEAALLVGVPLARERSLLGGQHAVTILASDAAGAKYVVREFPEDDMAPFREVDLLSNLGAMGDLVPGVVAHDLQRDRPILVTTYLPGGPPAPSLPLDIVATEMARVLARVHTQSGRGTRIAPEEPPRGTSTLARRARADWGGLDMGDRVLTHYDYWCGNTLWLGSSLTGVVDWSGARQGPRGVDLAWCRQDLVLLGSPSAASVFLEQYEQHSGHTCHDMAAWDLQAAALADHAVETWSKNYSGVGRPEITAAVLRDRLDRWSDVL